MVCRRGERWGEHAMRKKARHCEGAHWKTDLVVGGNVKDFLHVTIGKILAVLSSWQVGVPTEGPIGTG